MSTEMQIMAQQTAALPFGQAQLLNAILKALGRLKVKDLNCRQFNAVIEATNDIIAALRMPHRPAAPLSGLAAWLNCDETGLSSLYMAHVLGPLAGLRNTAPPPFPVTDPHPYPHDPSDFARCLGLLAAEPSLRPHLPALADGHGPEWAALAGAWPELEALYHEERPTGKAPKLYARMRELLEATARS